MCIVPDETSTANADFPGTAVVAAEPGNQNHEERGAVRPVFVPVAGQIHHHAHDAGGSADQVLMVAHDHRAACRDNGPSL